jgi:glycine/D-amino acid oxidase-like deaminating enzyme
VTPACDAVVLGAGIVGAACALELASAGLSVVVVERDAVGSGATAAGMGHVVAMDDSEAQFALTSYSQSLWNALAPELPSGVEYHRCGTVWVAADDEEMDEVRRKMEFYAARGIDSEVLDASQLAEAEPNLRPGLAGGLLVPSDAVMYPPCAAGYLIERAQERKARLILGRSVVSAGEGQVLLDDHTRIAAPIIVNATGALAPALTPGIQVRKRKGHLIITDRYPAFLRHQLVELGYLKSAHSTAADSVAFNVQPRRTGQLLLGSSRQFAAEDSGVDHRIVAAMIDRAALYMPGLASLSAIRVWAGFRAATPDKLPLIGPTADPSLYLATGHEGLGITTSLATARLLADHLLGRPSPIPLDPYLPSRMAMAPNSSSASYSAASPAIEVSHA